MGVCFGVEAFLFRVRYGLVMSVLDVILGRRSIRRYEDKELPKDVLDKIIEAVRQSPSAANRQPYRFVIVTDPEIKKTISGLVARFLKSAPVVIVGCANPKAMLTGKWATVDTTIALENMVLAAWSLGVGSCWVGSFNEQKVKDSLKIPQDWKVVALVSLGYPDETPKQRKKKTANELFSLNQF
jgi:nitroreductase